MVQESPWSVADSLQTYNVKGWGAGYFNVNDDGDITVRPIQEQGAEIVIRNAVEEARERGLGFPLLLRFQDLLRHRVETLNKTFASVIEEAGYTALYRGVFPIKVNQLREVVEEIVEAGTPFHYGIEVGSKPELFAALAMHKDNSSLIICNGYKDPLFVQMALLGAKLGKQVVLVVEKLEEMKLIIDISEATGVKPLIGIRVRLGAKGAGKWATSGGENAKFGLTTAEVLEATDMLREHRMEDRFVLMHFHIGSQIPEILTIKRAVREAARYYAKLRKMGFALEYMDVGGGLGVNYDGTGSAFDSSVNYTLAEYCRDIVYNIAEICGEEGVPHPNIVSESGRAIVAHHSVLIVDVFGMIEKTRLTRRNMGDNLIPAHKLAEELLELKRTLNTRNRREHYHDAVQIRDDAAMRFNLGLLELTAKAQIETLFWEIAEAVSELFEGTKPIPAEIEDLRESLSDQFVCNFSVFQSLLDHWALGQLFPIVPIHRLNERPDHNGTLVDITCDSDGKVSKFIDAEWGHRANLPLHAPDGKPYYLGFFLMGAYQDIMGDLHNLFGRVNEAHIFLDPDEETGFYIEETIPGSTIRQVLSDVQYDIQLLERSLKAQVDAAIKADVLKPNEGMRLLSSYEQGLRQATYLQF